MSGKPGDFTRRQFLRRLAYRGPASILQSAPRTIPDLLQFNTDGGRSRPNSTRFNLPAPFAPA
jgi:hypothetical protein